MICFPTVMHTGTRTCMHMLDIYFRGTPAGQKFNGIAPFKDLVEDNQIYAGHCLPGLGWEKVLGEYPVITTLRHPARVFESYLIRSGELEKYIVQWDYLLGVVDSYDPVYIVVDNQAVRDKQLKKAAALFGAKPKTKWEILGSFASTYDMDITDEMLERVPGKFIDFYMEKLKA